MAFNNIDDCLGKSIPPQIKELLDGWNNYYQKLVYKGGEIFNEILQKPNLGKADSLPTVMLLRNAIELFDSISLLINNCCSEPARILLRTLLETSFYCQYLAEKDSPKRALSFLICHYHQKLDFNYKLDPKREQGKQFIKDLAGDKILPNYRFTDQSLLNKEINDLKELVNDELFKDVEKEYQRLRKDKSYRRPKWYEFYNGPTSIERLAKYLNQSSLYNFLYRSLSKDTHGNNIIDGLISPGNCEGELMFSQIRFPYSAQVVTQFSFTIILQIYRTILSYHLPEREDMFNTFYNIEIKDFLNRLRANLLYNN